MPDVQEVAFFSVAINQMSRNMCKKAMLVLTLLGFVAGVSVADDYVKAEIYYHDWDLDLRLPMSSADVRERYLTKLIIRDEEGVRNVVRNLPLADVHPLASPIESPDIRLVIDLTSSDGEIDSYCVSRFHFFDDTGINAAELSPSFSQEFKIRVIFSAEPNK